MTQKINKEINKSLYDKYMHTMMGIIKFSSFSLATMSLGEKKINKKNGAIASDSVEKLTSYSSNSQLDKQRRSQTLVNKSQVQTYVVEKDAGDHGISPAYVIYGSDDDESFSDYIKRLHKRNQTELNKSIINVKSAAYITKFHEKNSRDVSLASSTGFPLVLPPPPPHFKK